MHDLSGDISQILEGLDVLDNTLWGMTKGNLGKRGDAYAVKLEPVVLLGTDPRMLRPGS